MFSCSNTFLVSLVVGGCAAVGSAQVIYTPVRFSKTYQFPNGTTQKVYYGGTQGGMLNDAGYGKGYLDNPYFYSADSENMRGFYDENEPFQISSTARYQYQTLHSPRINPRRGYPSPAVRSFRFYSYFHPRKMHTRQPLIYTDYLPYGHEATLLGYTINDVRNEAYNNADRIIHGYKPNEARPTSRRTPRSAPEKRVTARHITEGPEITTNEWGYQALRDGKLKLASGIFEASLLQAETSAAHVGLGLVELITGQYGLAISRLSVHLSNYPVVLEQTLSSRALAEQLRANLASYARLHPEDSRADDVLEQLASPNARL